MASLEACYAVHGQTIRFSTESPALAVAAAEALTGFPMGRTADTVADLVVRLEGVSAAAEASLQLPQSATLVRRSQEADGAISFALRRDGSRWFFDFGETGLMCLDPCGARVEGWLADPDRLPGDLAASFVALAAIELLRFRGLYVIHAAGVEKDGAGILLVAPSGSGKTTACLSLVRAGFRYLSDDHPLVVSTGTGFELLPFPGRPAVSDRTLDWFPELATSALRQGTSKRSFRLEDAFPSATGFACRPRLLLFVRIADRPRSIAEPISPARALEDLLPQTLWVLDPTIAARQFHAMAEMVRRTPCFRLHFGEDVLELPALLDHLLASIDQVEA
jgi:hypothetical protein